MTAAITLGTYNVEATLRAWAAAAMAAYTPLSSAGVQFVVEDPEQPLDAPTFTAVFSELDEVDTFQGAHVGSSQHGAMLMGMMHVVMYASRTNAAWRAQLAQMTDAIRVAFRQQASGAIIVKDFYTSASAPQDTAYRVTLRRLDQALFPVSLNPAIEGAALHIVYQYTERA